MRSLALSASASYVACFHAKHASDLRTLTPSEVQLFAEASLAGAVLVGWKLREYLSGGEEAPFNAPSTTWAPAEAERRDNAEAIAACEAAKAMWERFLSRLTSGDLRVLAERIDAERAPALKAVA